MKNKIVDIERLVTTISDMKREGKKIVATGGCFDILHAGHVQYLEKSKEYGDILVLFLNSDKSIKQIKGNERPIVSEQERAEVVAGLGCVDYVCLFSETNPCRVIKEIQPDFWVKGADYEGKDIPEKKIIESYGGEIKYIRFKDGCSSTNIIEKIKSI